MIVKGYVYSDLGGFIPGVKVYIKENPSTFTYSDSNGEFKISVEIGQTIVYQTKSGQIVESIYNTKQDIIKVIIPTQVVNDVLPQTEEQTQKSKLNWLIVGLSSFGLIKLLSGGEKAKKVTI